MYDVIIVGGGPAGLFAAYELATKTNKTVLLIEKGKSIETRTPKEVMCGIGGAGTFSDGKLHFTPCLSHEKMLHLYSVKEYQEYVDYVDKLFSEFGVVAEYYPKDNEVVQGLVDRCTKNSIHLFVRKIRHVGSDKLPRVIENFEKYLLEKKIEIRTETVVDDIIVEENVCTGVIIGNERINARNVILAPGRFNARWMQDIAKKYGLSYEYEKVEVGVRVEFPEGIMREYSEAMYEAIFLMRTPSYDDVVRSFCLDGNTEVFVILNGELKLLKIKDLYKNLRKDSLKNVFVPSFDLKSKNNKIGVVQGINKKKFNGEMLSILTERGRRITLTEDHIVFNEKCKEIKAGSLKIGDYIAIPRKIDLFSSLNVFKLNLLDEIKKNVPQKYINKVYVRGVLGYIERIAKENNLLFSEIVKIAQTYKYAFNGKARNKIKFDSLQYLLNRFPPKNLEIQNWTLSCMGSNKEMPVLLDISSNLARLLGYFVAEGNYNVCNGSYNLVLSVSKQDILKDMVLCMKSIDSSKSTKNKERNQYIFGSLLIYLLFYYVLKIKSGAPNKNIPDMFFNFNKCLQKEFLSGLFSGDGSVDLVNQEIFLGTTSKELANQLSYILLNKGIDFTLKEEKTNPPTTHHARDFVPKDFYRVRVRGYLNMKKLFKEFQFKDNRRKNIQKKIINMKISNSSGNITKFDNKKDLIFLKIKDIKRQKKKMDVYDLTMKQNPNFVAGHGGILVHNCPCPKGLVAIEDYDGFVCVNGHSNSDHKSDNSNFAFVTEIKLTEPVENTTLYAKSIAQLANTIGGGKPIVQRLADLRSGKRSTWERINKSYVTPSLKDVVPGDISMAFPHRVVTNIIEGLRMLDKVMPGIYSGNTLLYAPEIKLRSSKIKTNKHLETEIKGLFVAGDGAGVAGNIVGAAATGVIAARGIV